MRIAKFSHMRITLIAIVSIAVAGGMLYMLQSQDKTIEQSQANKIIQPPKKIPEAYVPGLPLRLIIPKISVNATIEGLGLTSEGNLDAPKNIVNVGWYNAGPRAGSPGSAVMDGHFGAADGKQAVFDGLHTLQKGDILYVEDSNGGTHTFTVRETRLFQPDEDASEVFRSIDKRAQLNLITCQGEWDKRNESYSTRLVVFTDLLND